MKARLWAPFIASMLVVVRVAAGQGTELTQPIQLADRGPVFFSVTAEGDHVDARGTTMLQRRIALELDAVSVGDALRAVSLASGLVINFSPDELPLSARVTVGAHNLTIEAALTVVLLGTGLDVEIADGQATIVRRGPAQAPLIAARRQQGASSVTGHVTDGALKTPLSDVTVRIEGTTLGTTASADGKYTIAGIAPGTYRVTARRVGYQPLTKDITVATDQQLTLDFALVAAATRLDEVVTTAVGQQRRYEVGNDISTINADSIAPTAPITSLTDLISARAPGVTVLENSGMTGSGEAIRIEGLTSLVLQNDPILIVDGIRQDNSAGGDISAILGQFGGGTHPTPTRLNDIDFNDIESIDILKGPAASTEYGTDAASGVIVITTKHGAAGAPEWKASAEQTESDIPESFPNGYYSWGHTTNGTQAAVDCTVNEPYGGGFAQYGSPYNIGATAGSCIVDSVTRWNPLNHAATSIFGTGNRAKYDLSVGGGSDAVRYFVSGGLSNETGVIRMPAVFRELVDTADIGLPSSALNPNGEQQRSVRVNTAIKLGPTADLTATGSYLSTYQQTPNAGQLYTGVFYGSALSGAAHYYGYGAGAYGEGVTPLGELTEVGSQNTDRLTGGLTANWRPIGWFTGHVTAGLDHGSQLNQALTYPLSNPVYEYNGSPFLGISNATTDVYSVDLRGTATASFSNEVRAVTSGGLQMVDTRTAGQVASSSGITATNLTLNGATGPSVAQLGTRQATLGGYAEEQLSLADRLFLTGALRIDAASGFGSAYSVAEYPKASASWLVLDQASTTVRVRGAFGESGVQPMNGAALQLYQPTVVYLGGSAVSSNELDWPGNANLQPERSAEFEGGVDVTGWANRVTLALIGYSKTTRDALVDVNLGGTLGSYTYQENIGEVQNTGLEASATIGVVQTRLITWDVAVNGSVNHNQLMSLAPGVVAQTVYNGVVEYRQAVGYPLYGIWAQPVHYADVNHDGIIEPGEAVLGDSAEYAGSSLPTQEVSISTHLGFWNGAITIGRLVDYRGGYKIGNGVGFEGDAEGNSQGANAPTAPLELQARAVAASFNALNVEGGSFVRVREVSATYAVPRSLVRGLHVENLTVTAAVRNLALWTRYTGVDPEVTNSAGNVQSVPTTGGYEDNNNMREDLGAVPLLRYWVIRLNVGM